MRLRAIALLMSCVSGCGLLIAAEPGAAPAESPWHSTLVALVDDETLRREFEDSLAAKGREHGFNTVASHTLVPRVQDFEKRRFPAQLGKAGINVVVMMRPASIGAGSSLESVRDSLPPELYQNIRKFAGSTSSADADDLIAIVHVAIYALTDKPRLVTAGAVWLSEPVQTREEGIARLQDMLITNVETSRDQIRAQLEQASPR